MLVPYGSMLHIPPASLLLLAAKQEPYKKAYLFMKSIEKLSGKKGLEKGPVGRRKKRRRDRKSNGSRQKNKRGDSKVESDDSPEIPGGRHQTSAASLQGDQTRYSRKPDSGSWSKQPHVRGETPVPLT